MWMFEGAWGIHEGFGKRRGMEAIAGLVGLGADF
jgi:hypothetical protein